MFTSTSTRSIIFFFIKLLCMHDAMTCNIVTIVTIALHSLNPTSHISPRSSVGSALRLESQGVIKTSVMYCTAIKCSSHMFSYHTFLVNLPTVLDMSISHQVEYSHDLVHFSYIIYRCKRKSSDSRHRKRQSCSMCRRVSFPCWHATLVANVPWKPSVIRSI